MSADVRSIRLQPGELYTPICFSLLPHEEQSAESEARFPPLNMWTTHGN